MFVETVTSKGRLYLYLKKYQVREHYCNNKVTLFGFGREEIALQKMYSWESNFASLPQELKDIGCTKDDLRKWIAYLEKKIEKPISLVV